MKLSKAVIGALMWGLAAPASAGSPDDAGINAVYAKLSQARAAHDVEGMVSAFSSDGLLVDARPGPVITGGELEGRLRPMAERVANEGIKIATSYRLERRSVMGDVALDAGYMRQTMERPNAEQTSRYSRFLVTMRRETDGVWRIIGDASMPAEQAQFDALKPVQGLYYEG